MINHVFRALLLPQRITPSTFYTASIIRLLGEIAIFYDDVCFRSLTYDVPTVYQRYESLCCDTYILITGICSAVLHIAG